MKHFYLFFVLTFLCYNLFAQSPQVFKYQAVVRNGTGTVITNQSVNLRVSLLQTSATGTQVYSEEHVVTTNAFGLINVEIGNGTNISGTFSAINWSAGPYFIKLELDATGGNTFSEMGTTQLLSVPYALFAASGNQGPQGIQGSQGPAGNNGQDGISIANAQVQNDSLNITLSSGQILHAGYVKGAQGIQGLQGVSGTNGTNGANGTNGISVINTYVQNDSLIITFSNSTTINAGHVRGAQGLQGIQGPAGTGLNNRGNWINGTLYSPSDYVFDRSTNNPAVNSMWICQATASFTSNTNPYLDGANWVEFQAPAGPQGIQGIQGNQGIQGIQGQNGISITWLGVYTTAPVDPILNEAYYNSTDKKAYIWDGLSWNIITQDGNNGADGVQGSQGIQGIQGIQGVQGITGQNGVSIQWVGELTTAPLNPSLNQAYYNSMDKKSYIWDGILWNILAQDGMNGIQGVQGLQGVPGIQGIAGAQGIQGIQGIQGFTGQNGISVQWLGEFTTAPLNPTLNQAYYNSTDKKSNIWNGTSWQVIAQDGAIGSQGLQGTQGIQGVQGIQGTQGIQGPIGLNGISIIWLGSYNTAPASPALNNAYYNTITKKSFIWDGSAWQIISQDGISGIQGIQGIQGIPGNAGLNGSSIVWLGTYAVAPASPSTNQAYYNSVIKKSYIWDGTSWQIITQDGNAGIQGIQGLQGNAGTNGTNGANGYSVLNGTSDPVAQGILGDFFINTTSNKIFGPKSGGGWGTGTTLIGPQGIQGIQGTAGTGLTNKGNWLTGTMYSNGDYVFDRSLSNAAVNSMWICQTSSFTSNTQPYLDAAHWVEFQAPQGPQGIQGIQGTQGIQGPAGTYAAGTGISLTSGIITNTAPDQTIVLSGTGSTSITGTYPNFTINSTDNNTTYAAGTGLLLTGTTFSANFGISSTTIAAGNHAHSNDHPRLHNITNTLDVSATANRIFYSNSTGGISEMAFGTAGQVLSSTGTSTAPSWIAINSGTVTSVGLSLPSIFTVSGSPVTISGTLSATLNSQAANTFFAAPNGTSGTPGFRTIVAADLPGGSENYIQNQTTVDQTAGFRINGNGIFNGGKVGIGTINPSNPFTVQGLYTGTNRLMGLFYNTDVSAGSSANISTKTGSGDQFDFNQSDMNYTGVPAYAGFGDISQNTNGIMLVAAGVNGIQRFLTGGNSVANNTRMIIDKMGNVGIGTITPRSKLDVEGGITTFGTLDFSSADGTNGVNANGQTSYSSGGPKITANTLAGNGEMDFISPAYDSGTLALSFLKMTGSSNPFTVQSASPLMVIQRNGNVGIGTSSPAANLSFGTGINTNKIYLFDDASTSKYGFGIAGGTLQIYAGADLTSNKIAFGKYDGTTFIENVRFQNDGNVGIGSTSPVGKLSIEYSYDDPSPRAKHIYLTDPANSNLKGFIGLNRNSAAGTDKEYLSIESVEENVHWMNIALAVDGGNVGVGWANPYGKLTVLGGGNNTNNYNTYASDVNREGLLFNSYDLGSPNTWLRIHDIVGSSGNTASKLRFLTADWWTYSPVERMVINPNGYVGIGTSNPNYNLDLNNGTIGYGVNNTRTEARNNAGLQGDAGAQSGFYEAVAPVNFPNTSVWWHLIDCRHDNPSNNYALQIAGSFFDQNLWFRKTNNSATTSWQRILSSADITGTPNYLAKFTNTNSIGNSLLYETGTRIGVGTTTPSGRMMVQQDAAAADNEPIFEVKDKAGQTVMVLYKDSVHFYVKDPGAAKTENRGTFAVSGKSQTKSFTNNYLFINSDSTRIYTTDTTKGFGVRNLAGTTKSNYMQITPNNIFIGHESGIHIDPVGFGPILGGLYNSFIGFQSGKFNTTGRLNTAFGYQAMFTNTTGIGNISIGYQSLYYNVDGTNNIAVGASSLLKNINGTYNVAVGNQVLQENLSGTGNTSCGYLSSVLTKGNYNASLGMSALRLNTTGNYNTAVGYQAFYSGTYSNSTALGANASINNSNQIRVGDASVTSAWIQVGWSIGSDGRIKKNVQENVPGLDFINQLRPVTYNYDIRKENELLGVKDSLDWEGKYDIENIQFSGFIAQEVDEAAQKIGYNFSGVDKGSNLLGLRYSEFVVPIVKAMQELNSKNEDQKKINDELQKKNDELQKRIEALEKMILSK